MEKDTFTVIVVPHDPQKTRNYKISYRLFYVLVTFLAVGLVAAHGPPGRAVNLQGPDHAQTVVRVDARGGFGIDLLELPPQRLAPVGVPLGFEFFPERVVSSGALDFEEPVGQGLEIKSRSAGDDRGAAPCVNFGNCLTRGP